MPDPRYSSLVLAHFDAPGHAGALPAGPGMLCSGSAGAREQGTVVSFQLRILDGHIAAAGFLAYGCPHSIAACDLACEWLNGAPVERIATLRAAELAHALQLPAPKLGRLLLVEDALRNCGRAWDNSQLSVAGPQGDQ